MDDESKITLEHFREVLNSHANSIDILQKELQELQQNGMADSKRASELKTQIDSRMRIVFDFICQDYEKILNN